MTRNPHVLCVGLVTLDVIQTVDDLPRSNVGKILRRELRDAAAGAASSSNPT